MQETGLSVYQAFKRGIADPLGMQDFGEDAVILNYERGLSRHPKAGFRMSARDLAKFGQLYLNKGKWNGKQIVPEAWIDRIVDDYTVTGNDLLRSGHGYLWWVPIDKKAREMGIPDGTMVAAGFGSQRIVVIPRWNTVIVHQVNVIDCIVAAMQEHETSFKGAIIRLYLCRYPFFSLREECRECGFVGNFVNSGFVKILSKIIDARQPENIRASGTGMILGNSMRERSRARLPHLANTKSTGEYSNLNKYVMLSKPLSASSILHRERLCEPTPGNASLPR